MSFHQSFEKLAQILTDHPELVEVGIIERGKMMISIHRDPRFDFAQPSLFETSARGLLQAAEDFASGAARLAAMTVGTYNIGTRYESRWLNRGDEGTDTVVTRISLQDRAHFAQWPTTQDLPSLTQDEVNDGVYYLAESLAQLRRDYQASLTPARR